MRFLTSKEYTFPYSVGDLIAVCIAELKKLEEAGVDANMRSEVCKIFNDNIDRYI